MVFRPGQSGNPAGKPKGCGDKRFKFRQYLELAAENAGLVDILIRKAQEGDMAAMRLVLERIAPKPKSETRDLGLDFSTMTLKEATEKLISLNLIGDLPEDQSKSLIDLMRLKHDIDTRAEDNKRVEDALKLQVKS